MVGVSLADRTDPDKSFAPCKEGLVLGVMYNTDNFTWWVREDKLARICTMLVTVIEGQEEVNAVFMLSLAGKLVDVRLLVPGGKFNIAFILAAANSKMNKEMVIHVTDSCRSQCQWWLINLQAAAKSSRIQRPVIGISPIAIKGWTDAAGGSLEKVGHGLGGLIPPYVWFYLPWPTWLNQNKVNNQGVKFSRKLTCLEMLGPLVLLCLSPNMVRNQHFVSFVDNQGAVDIYRKVFSTSCFYSYTIAKAIFDVSRALNCTVHVQKITRCSDTGSVASDMLSKAEFESFYKLMPRRNTSPERIPRAILNWINDPTVDLKLGDKILQEMAITTKLLGYNV